MEGRVANAVDCPGVAPLSAEEVSQYLGVTHCVQQRPSRAGPGERKRRVSAAVFDKQADKVCSTVQRSSLQGRVTELRDKRR